MARASREVERVRPVPLRWSSGGLGPPWCTVLQAPDDPGRSAFPRPVLASALHTIV